MFNNIPQTLVILGLLTLIIEVLILGCSTFVLLFFGIAMLLTSGLIYMGMIEANWISTILTLAIITLALAIVLWKPLKKLQNKPSKTDIKSDFAVITFKLEKDLSPSERYTFNYSGIQWQIKSETQIEKGVMVEVIKKEVGVLWVKPVDKS
ncbi:activity regulator of membrane protease YbbK [Photobacterium iliopiscarium]|uniref:Activity regulator of membrane protease YbbK n=1 Tax=Photobacterium iliopiscarium TaxID=56192 RepID=A0ABX5GT18_9GAMM|nr:NfeD family protein [Photobacterium iliopiscarium]KJG13837.1 activity regulator of membrane protease YbbK [Photobacterium iliopiscarium]KJG20389.1 activity regulator of membrane protease YbbK [Photobacterium iliopiscarium]PST95612.1 activity regulator of membrane protease YbbK [Photobacterium iliopiscarium]PSU00916.1 activity regulator of membrane protease YbbK [Photobacterium iliopiscarium]PSV82123.1 activity regulator of membrane protease YbbK [Photobacterium iliopiscarium]